MGIEIDGRVGRDGTGEDDIPLGDELLFPREFMYKAIFRATLHCATKIHSDFVTADDRVFRELCSSPFCCIFLNIFFLIRATVLFTFCIRTAILHEKHSEKNQFETQYFYYLFFIVLHYPRIFNS